jgi:hypothetical protein
MSEFVNHLESGLSPEGLKGLIIRREKTIIQDNKPFRVDDLNSLPFPKPNRYLDLEKYSRFGKNIVVLNQTYHI